MELVLPFPCKTLKGIMNKVVLIGFPFLLIISIIHHTSPSNALTISGIAFGGLGTLLGWITQILFWVDSGKIRCKCDE